MATTLPVEIYDTLERKVGRDDARAIGKVIEFSFNAIERKAEDVAIRKKFELKDELTKELASKADVLLVKTELKAEIDSVRGDIEKLGVELRAEFRAELRAEINSVMTEINSVRAEIRTEINSVRAEIISVRAEIGRTRMEIDNKLDKLDAKFRIYFLILLFTVIIMNPKSIELITKLLSLLK